MTRRHPLNLSQLAFHREYMSVPPAKAGAANLFDLWKLPSGLSVRQVSEALSELVRRHETLRTRFDLSDPERPEQIVEPSSGNTVTVLRTSPEDLEGLLFRMRAGFARQGIDLLRRQPWAAQVVVTGGKPTHVGVVIHHIAVDMHSFGLLRRDFLDILLGRGGKDLGPSPAALAESQRSQGWEGRLRRNRRYLESTVDSLGDRYHGPPFLGSSEAAVLCETSSLRAGRAARAVAGSTGVPVSAVVLAAYRRAIADRSGPDPALVRMASSNRFEQRTRSVVGVMNQWALLSLPSDGRSLAEDASLAQARALKACRHSVFDPRDVEDLLGHRWGASAGPGHFFNYLGDSVVQAPPGASDGEPEVLHRIPTNTTGPSFYLVAELRGELTLVLRSMWPGFGPEEAARTLACLERDVVRAAENL